jgi:hypothetical protein
MLNSIKGENYEKVNHDGSKFIGKSGRLLMENHKRAKI